MLVTAVATTWVCLSQFAMSKKRLSCGLQGVYRAFVRNAKFMTQSSAPDIAFVGSCVVEMYGLDLVRAYEHAFTYIKELASLLRGAMSSHSKDAYRQVYCWQTVNTLELWSKLLAAHHDKEVSHLGSSTVPAQNNQITFDEHTCTCKHSSYLTTPYTCMSASHIPGASEACQSMGTGL